LANVCKLRMSRKRSIRCPAVFAGKPREGPALVVEMAGVNSSRDCSASGPFPVGQLRRSPSARPDRTAACQLRKPAADLSASLFSSGIATPLLVPGLRDVAFKHLALVIQSPPKIVAFAVDLHRQASGARDFHPRAVSEPDVILSLHPAPIVQPYGFALSTKILQSPVVPAPELNNATPSLQPHYRAFIPTTGWLRPCAPHRYSHPHRDRLLGFLPCHRGDRFPRSTRKPDPEPRRLHAGCPLGRNQVASQTRPGLTSSPRFRYHHALFDTSSAGRLRSSL
jgi:hypothetical protein